tara:strand:+ start:1369 stop:2007 length:639 start_codon:yes stop_codon:yes gene_type:complete
MADCKPWLSNRLDITILQNEKYADTWSVWEKRRWLAGIKGASCTGELKVQPRLDFQRDDDIHIFGYTADSGDVARAEGMAEHWPDLKTEFPLIERGLTKAACLAMIERAGIKPPLTYAQGFPNANCIPCVKATSPRYWALVRHHYPSQFERMVRLSRELGVRLARIDNERVFIDEIPLDHPMTKAMAPDCDFLCSLSEQDFMASENREGGDA